MDSVGDHIVGPRTGNEGFFSSFLILSRPSWVIAMCVHHVTRKQNKKRGDGKKRKTNAMVTRTADPLTLNVGAVAGADTSSDAFLSSAFYDAKGYAGNVSRASVMWELLRGQRYWPPA